MKKNYQSFTIVGIFSVLLVATILTIGCAPNASSEAVSDAPTVLDETVPILKYPLSINRKVVTSRSVSN